MRKEIRLIESLQFRVYSLWLAVSLNSNISEFERQKGIMEMVPFFCGELAWQINVGINLRKNGERFRDKASLASAHLLMCQFSKAVVILKLSEMQRDNDRTQTVNCKP